MTWNSPTKRKTRMMTLTKIKPQKTLKRMRRKMPRKRRRTKMTNSVHLSPSRSSLSSAWQTMLMTKPTTSKRRRRKKDDEEEKDGEEYEEMDCEEDDPEMAENMSSVGSLLTASSVPPPSLDDMSTELGEYYIAWETEGNTDSDGRKAIDLWTRCQSSVARLLEELCEQLHIILEPTLATQLKGDYRTGKRINMKKVIPYIASQFKKDKIWLCRTHPHKCHYQVLLAIDNSESMKQNHAGEMPKYLGE